VEVEVGEDTEWDGEDWRMKAENCADMKVHETQGDMKDTTRGIILFIMNNGRTHRGRRIVWMPETS
jgi:uncharacterized damage-inducible protein DinB